MSVNTHVYGNKSTWLPIRQDSSVKLARFTESESIADNIIKTAFTSGVFKADKPYDSSVAHSALGTESMLSHISTYKGGTLLTTDDNNSTPWSFATGTGGNMSHVQSVTTYSNVLTPKTHNNIINSACNPVVDFDYKTLRAVIKVRCYDADFSNPVNVDLATYISDYAASKPKVTCAYLELYDKGTVLSIQGYKGLIIHTDSTYTTNFKLTKDSDYFKNGHIGTYLGTWYGSTGSNANITFYGLLNQNLGSAVLNDNYIDIVAGDLDTVLDSDNRATFYKDYYDGFAEFCIRQVACFGIQFVLDTTYIDVDLEDPETSPDDANQVYIGVLDDSYIGHGDYVRGTAILKQQQYILESADASPYVSSGDDAFDRGDLDSLTHSDISGTGGYTIYNLNDTMMSNLIIWLNSAESGEGGQNYSQYLMSIKYSPFGYHLKGDSETLKVAGHLVNVDTTAVTGCRAYRMDTFDTDTISIDRYYNNFLDFKPYTTMTLKIPFGDTLELDPGEWYGYGLKIRYAVDEITGTGAAMIYKVSSNGALQWSSVNVSMFVDVPVSALNAGTYHNALIQAKNTRNSALLGVATSSLSLGASIATGDAQATAMSGAGLVGSIAAAKQADYNLTHISKSISTVSSAGDISDSYFDWRPNLVIEHRKLLDFDKRVYRDTVGYACLKTVKLGSMSGFTVCSDVDLSGITATATEKAEIKAALQSGVYL